MIDEEIEDDNYLEIPSCIESLTSSAGQLQQLASQVVYYYQKLLLSYGYSVEAKFSQLSFDSRSVDSNDQRVTTSFASATNNRSPRNKIASIDLCQLINDGPSLRKFNSMLKILPLLNELSSLVERCFATMESTFKRATYHLMASSTRPASSAKKNNDQFVSDGPFKLSGDLNVDPIFVALMDLIYALMCLEQTLKRHTNLAADLSRFVATCQVVIDLNSDDCLERKKELEELEKIPTDKLRSLVDFVSTIKLTLTLEETGGQCKTLFSSFLEQFQHLDLILSKEKTRPGFDELCRLTGQFLAFYIEFISSDNNNNSTSSEHKLDSRKLLHLNLVPGLFMSSATSRLFGVTGLLNLYAIVFKKTVEVKKWSKSFNQMLRKCAPRNNLIPLEGSNCYINLSSFLRQHQKVLPIQVELKLLDFLEAELDSRLIFELEAKPYGNLSLETISWISNAILEESDPIEFYRIGTNLAREIRSSIRSSLAIYLHFSKPMSKNNLISIYKLVALLKSIEGKVLLDGKCCVEKNLVKLEQTVRLRWRKLFVQLRKEQLKLKYSERKLSLNTLLALTSICLRPELLLSSQGCILISLCLSMLLPVLNQRELIELNQLLSLNSGRTLVRQLKQETECSFLYWNLATFNTFYTHILEEFPGTFNELHCFHRALSDIPQLLATSEQPVNSKANLHWLLEERNKLIKQLGDELLGQFRSDFLDRVCQELEVELRLQTHRELWRIGGQSNSLIEAQAYDFKHMFSSQQTTFKLFNQTIGLQSYVEHYLNKICYNLTALAPHDWFAYDSMMNLARQKYNLKFVNTQLPARTIDSGLDLLDIIRNLPMFASRYSYDLTYQLFIEKCSSSAARSSASIVSTGMAGSLVSNSMATSSSQSLNVLQIKHISKSLQAHGFGLLDSAVNCTYLALRKLINLFSRQLSDEKLRASLQRQLLELNSANSPNKEFKISYEQADRMAKRFKLKASSFNQLNSSGKKQQQPQVGVDLDSIRQTVTHLGNLLAFIRMLKSGALNCASKSVDYVPELSELSDLRLANLVKQEFGCLENAQVGASLQEACKNLDQCLCDLDSNFSPSTNYLDIIVKLFSELLATKEEATDSQIPLEAVSADAAEKQVKKMPANKGKDHLKLFFVLVPALSIDYIDYLINCKERLTARSSTARFGALISDDGFPMGVAYLLTILGQTRDFVKLQWLPETCLKLEEEIREIEKRFSDTKFEESLRQTASMTLRRLRRLCAEYKALDYTLNCALLLFKTSSLETNNATT